MAFFFGATRSGDLLPMLLAEVSVGKPGQVRGPTLFVAFMAVSGDEIRGRHDVGLVLHVAQDKVGPDHDGCGAHGCRGLDRSGGRNAASYHAQDGAGLRAHTQCCSPRQGRLMSCGACP